MGNIVLLDELTINQIAAGEVIERPASVIKEMVENSIDAGAKNITVEIKNGGISLIKITDDGCGIAEDDMEMAFERHATSKIRHAEDLANVKSMGFRGEALASIAAIANVEMVSKRETDEVAHKIIIEGGKVLEKSEEARGVGTTITVQKLFYNTPVRYKFLKKDYTEAGYIEDAITRIALVNKDVAFRFINNGKTVLQTNGNGDLKTVIYSIYGKDIASEIIDIDYTYEDIKITGAIGKPVIARANRSHQLFFVNHRYIKDKNLSAAAEQSYKGMIPVGRYGFVILNLDMDPKMVDVNVHPAKLEVRFEEENKVFKAVYHAIKSGLANVELVENVQKQQTENITETSSTDAIKNIQENLTAETKETTEKKGLSGLFQKILKEPEETEEEKNNPLEEIYKFRKGLQKDDTIKTPISETENTVLEETKIPVENNENSQAETILSETLESNVPMTEEKLEEIPEKEQVEDKKIINQEEVSKTVQLDNVSISSDTRELDVAKVNEAVKDKTQEVLSTKLDNENQETQIIANVNMNTEKKMDTQILETENLKSEDIAVAEDSVNLDENHTVMVDTLQDETKETTPNVENTLENGQSFEEIASQLVEAKLSLDNTQTIDSAKVREALKSEFFEENPEFDQMYRKTFGVDTASVRREKATENLENQKLNASNDFSYATENVNVFDNEEEKYPEIHYKFIGIAFNTYIIIEIKDVLYMIDQHAAHERIMYEKVKANYYSEEQKDEQYLLLPDVITLPHKEMLIAKENADMFKKAGFTFEEFGENTIKLTSVPSMCEDLNTKQLFLDILDEIDTVAVTARKEKEDKFIATVACKAAVKGKMKLDEKEVHSLMAKLLELPNPFTCPHGRPTAIKMTKYDMERKFSRK